jgi:SAM-dependent methyltransferase
MTADHSMYSGKSEGYFENPRTEIAPLLPRRVDRVLDLGCGSGATMKWLRGQRDLRYAVGIELFPEVAERATSVFDLLLTGDIETMTLPTGHFDLIIALDVLEHLVDPWSAVRRLQSILSPGGAIIVSLPNIGHYSVSVPLVLRGRWNYAEDGLLDRTHLRFFTAETAIDLLTSSGLAVDKIDRVRRGPQLRSAKARWYALKFLTWALPNHLLDWQLLIRLEAGRQTSPATGL